MRRLMVGMVLGLALTAMPTTAQSPGPVVPCAEPLPPATGVVTIEGGRQNEANTAPFTLPPGDYLLVLEGEASERSNVILTVVGPGRPDYDSVWNEIEDKGDYRLETYLYGVEGGEYHVEYDLPRGSWTLTLTPA